MKYKGEHKDVKLRGIELAGSDRAVAAGGMNEVVGLVERDGMWEPYGLTSEFTRMLPSITVGGLTIACKRVYVHKTSAGNNALLLYANGDLKWVDYARFSNSSMSVTTADLHPTGLTGVEEIALVGNMITDQNLNSVLFRDDEYVSMDTTIEGESLPNVQLRVRCDYDFEADATKAEYGTGCRLMAKQNFSEVYTAIDYNTGAKYDAVRLSMPGLDSWKNVMAGLAQKCKGLLSKKGALTGNVMAVVAYRLTNGEYVLAGPPQLLGEPYVKFKSGDYIRETVTSNGKRVDAYYYDEMFDPSHPLYSLVSGADRRKNVYLDNMVYAPDVMYRAVSGADFTGYSTQKFPAAGIKADSIFIGNRDRIFESARDATYYNYTHNGEDEEETGVTVKYPCPVMYGIIDDDMNNAYGAVVGTGNILEYNINQNIDESLRTTIESVCIFLSREVSGYKPFQEENVIDTSRFGIYKSNTSQTIYTKIKGFYFSRRNDSEIIEELKKSNVFYRVKEIPFNEITSGGWIRVDLEGKLGDNLVELPTLQPSAFDNTKTYSGKLFAYNNRIHIFDYKQTPSKCTDIRPYRHQRAYGQWTPLYLYETGPVYFDGVAPVPNATYKWRIIAKCRGDVQGEYIIDTGEQYSMVMTHLPPMICYPNPDCYEIDVRIAIVVGMGHIIYQRVFPMELWKEAALAVYISSDMKPIEWSTFEILSDDSELDVTYPAVEYTYRNRMKASDIAFPFFPPAQTYIIGKSSIVGMATMSVNIGQDAYGRNPLIALCDDGIYTIGVDTSGKLAYDTINMFNPEVCLYRKSICSLGGAVLFVSKRGLMICTEKGVENFVPQALGGIRNMPINSRDMGSGMLMYYNILHTQGLTYEGAGVVDGVPFETYINNANTETNLLSTKQSILLYNPAYTYSYLIDIESRKLTKMPRQLLIDDDNYPEQMFYVGTTFKTAGRYSGEDNTQCLFQTRPIYFGGVQSRSFRVIMRGEFRGVNTQRAGIYVFGSLDGEHWKPMGAKEKVLSTAGFHDLGCETYRDRVAYLMIIFAGYLSKNSKIDRCEIDINE